MLHDCHLLDNVASASTSNMHVEVTRVNAHQVSVHLHGGAANPLVPAAPAIDWDLTGLPVPTELLVYTIDEWRDLETSRGRFASMLLTETVWVR